MLSRAVFIPKGTKEKYELRTFSQCLAFCDEVFNAQPSSYYHFCINAKERLRVQ